MAYSKDTGSEQQFTYQTLGGIHTGDNLATRRSDNNYTEITREYESTSQNIQFTGTGNNDLVIDFVTNQVDTTVTIDSQNNFGGIFSGSTTSNDVSVDYASYTGQRPIQFTFGIDAVNDDLSTGSGGFTGTPINGEVFNDGLGNSFKFISYDIGTDTIYAFAVVGNVTGLYTGINSGATVTLVNTFTSGSSEVGIWTDSLGNNGVWSIAITVPYTIGAGADTLGVTFASNGHNNGDFWNSIFVTGGVVYDVQSQSGPLTQGETLTGSLGTTATFGYQYNGAGLQIILTNIVGSLASGFGAETFTGSISGNTVLFNNPITYVDTYSATDGISTTTQNPLQTEVSNSLFGNINMFWGSEIGHIIGDQRQITFPIIPVNTGFRTEIISFPGLPFPLEASALVSDNGTDKAAIGVFDLTPFGQEDGTPAIIKFYGDGSQATFSMSKTFADILVFDQVAGKSANFSLNPQINNIGMSGYDGTTSYGWNATPNLFDYQTNGNLFKLPIVFNGVGSVVADMGGNGVLTLEPISSLISLDTIYTADGSLTSDRKVNMGSSILEFTGNNIYGSPVFFGNVNNYQGTGTGITGYSHGSNGGIKAQSIGYEPSAFVYEQYTGIGDFSNGLSNKSRTIYKHDSNIAVSTVNTRLVESTSSNSIFDETVTANGSNITSLKTYTLTSGALVSESVDTLVGEFIRTVSNSFNTNIYTQTKTGFGYSKYDNTRDDTGTTTPINFIYTDGSGKFLSAPLGAILPTKTTQIGTDGLGALFTGTVFTLPQIPSFIYGVYVNGQYQSEIVDYTVVGTDITFLTTLAGDLVTVVYEYF